MKALLLFWCEGFVRTLGASLSIVNTIWN